VIDGYTTHKWRHLKQAIASESYRICEGDSSLSKHLSQLGLFVNPILKRCPFMWQCAWSSPVTHRNLFRFSSNGSLVLPSLGPSHVWVLLKTPSIFLGLYLSNFWQPFWESLLRSRRLFQVLRKDIQVTISSTFNTPVTPLPYQLKSVMFSQFQKRISNTFLNVLLSPLHYDFGVSQSRLSGPTFQHPT
jgi:hypothetical protein